MLEARQVRFGFAARPLLCGVSLELRPGDLLGLVGRNGSGKSTLLRILAGELRPSEGEVVLEGRPLSLWEPEARARRVGVLSQEQPLSFPFRVREVVQLAWAARRIRSGPEAATTVDMLLDRFDLGGVADRPYTHLSGGERQRTHIGRVLAQVCVERPGEHRYLLLDEPTNHLDLRFQLVLLETLRELAREGVGILVVTHDVVFLSQCVEQVFLMECGRILAAGPPSGVLQSPISQLVFGVRFLGVEPARSDGKRGELVVPDMTRGKQPWQKGGTNAESGNVLGLATRI